MHNWFFVFPAILGAVLLLPVFFWVWTQSFKKAISWRFASVFEQVQWSDKKYFWIERMLFVLGFLLFALLLARPASISTNQTTTQHGVDIMFVVDISKSMITEDIAPNRIEAAKKVIAQFIASSKGNRIGCVIFAGKPFLLSPPTLDMAAIGQLVLSATTDSINQQIPGASGTAIGDGILLATNTLINMKDGAGREKIVVLLTDGEANMWTEPSVAAKYSAEKKVKIYALGIGNTKGSELFYTNELGEKVYFLDEKGKPIVSKVDEKMLTQLAQITNGSYFVAQDGDMLTQVFQELATEHAGSIEVKASNQTISQEKNIILLLAGVLFLLAFWRVRFGVIE